MKIAFLYTELSSYFLACLSELKDNSHKILLVYWPGSVQAPFQFETLSWIDVVLKRDQCSEKKLIDELSSFDPHVIYLSGWADPAYVKVARKSRKRSLIVVGIDNQWRGTIKQRIAALLSPWYLKSFIDIMWVAGRRQLELANRFGFSGANVWSGVYTCDWNKFSKGSGRNFEERRKAFLFIGRYSEEKGIQTLAEAYHLYRKETVAPWDLIGVGTGPFKSKEWNDPSIQHIGFLQPDALPALLSQCTTCILPSNYEPWGLVIHEATASGLPLICSDACGAADHLLIEGDNGYLFPSGSVTDLKNAMIKMSSQSSSDWQSMSDKSFEISKTFTPVKWVETLVRNAEGMLKQRETYLN